MALPLIDGHDIYYSINQDAYPIGVSRLIVKGDSVGIAIGDQVIARPIAGHYWGFDDLQGAIDGLASIVNTGVAVTNDPDAQAVIDAMVSPTPTQTNAINNFVIASKAAGNWALMDDFACGSLGDVTASNGLLKWKSLDQMVSNGGTTIDINGWNFNGTNAYVDSGYDPSLDAINYTLNDSLVGAFVSTNTGINVRAVFGTYLNLSGRLRLVQFPAPNIATALNSSQQVIEINTIDANTLHTITRSGITAFNLYKNGVDVSFNTSTSTQLATGTIFIGAERDDSNNAVGFYEGIISTFSIGAAIGFDNVAHNTNVRQLLSDLKGIDIDAELVINAMTNPTQQQQTAIERFIIQDKADGNWWLRDDFACGSLGDVTEANGLLKWKSLDQMTLNGGLTIDINGWNFNGTTAYVDSGYNPSIDGVKYTLNDAIASVFAKEITPKTATEWLFANWETGVGGTTLGISSGANRAIVRVNSLADTRSSTHVFTSNTLLATSRIVSNEVKLYEDGIEVPSVSDPRDSTAITNGNMLLGGLDDGGVVGFTQGVFSTFSVGAAIGFDHVADNLNQRQLLTDLGATL